MRQIYHSIITSHEEVMFRSDVDIGMFINLLALHSYRDHVDVLVDAELSTHAHLGLFAEAPVEFMWKLRISYDRLFNKKYGRCGRLGEKGAFLSAISGTNHICTFFTYVGRNGLHHGLSGTAFGYPHSSAKSLFVNELGLFKPKSLIISREEIASIIPRRYEFPDSFAMNENGVFERTSFLSTQMTEAYYGSARNYLYQMNRLSGEEWLKDQSRDGNGIPPLGLADIEPSYSVEDLLKNESGRGFRPDRPTDMEVCKLIDCDFVVRYGASSVYHLTDSQKQSIFKELRYERHLPEAQIRRCLVLPDIH